MRFFAPVEVWPVGGGEVLLDGPEGHHAASVMRVEPGDAVEIFDGRGRMGVGLIVERAKRSVKIRIDAEHVIPRRDGRLALAVAIPKKSTIEWIIEKAVELGVADIVPLLTQRTVVRLQGADRSDRQKKWERVAIEAAKQCRQDWLPTIHEPQSIDEALKTLPPDQFTWPLLACLQPDASPLAERLDGAGLPRTGSRSHLSGAAWIGPEGDFTDDEYDRLRSAGLRPVSLGSLVLRVETAALYTLSVLRFCTGG